MNNTFTQELKEHIAQLYSELRECKRALVNPLSQMDLQALSGSLENLEDRINELEHKLEGLLTIVSSFNLPQWKKLGG